MVGALCRELMLRKSYLPDNTRVETIYFGGGTPSLLDISELQAILDCVYVHYHVAGDAEITLEANPDDLSLSKLKMLRETPINRLSIGIQSFFEEDLRWMNRAHSASEAKTVLADAQSMGFENLTADLIYGYPLLTDEKWETNIAYLLQSGICHLSAYSMTVEKGTPLWRHIHKGQQKAMDEEQSAGQFLFLMEQMRAKGWEQYEISNFALDQSYSRHNTNYWRNVPYLGIGPSAHSFDGRSRQWNTKVNNRYLQGIAGGNPIFEKETLSVPDQVNEYIMTALRTMWGIDMVLIEQKFGQSIRVTLSGSSQPFIAQNQLILENEKLMLTQSGKLFADHIAAELFL